MQRLPKSSAPWALGLLSTLKDPNSVVKSDELVTVIKDKYPKAEFHFLVLPNADISNLKALNRNHLSLLLHIEKIAEEIIEDDKYCDKTFKLGYHAEASMHRLHLHIISDDMNSSCLKTKRHWNSFTTDFFISSEDIRISLEENGKVLLPSAEKCKEYLNTALKCHKCDLTPKTMPQLKRHILTHIK